VAVVAGIALASRSRQGRPPGDGGGPEPPEGTFAGLPYDFRRPTAGRIRARMWNPDDPRLLTPKSFGWGYDVNAYWLVHLPRYLKRRFGSRP
jgi:hypothetical protein